MVLTSAQLLGGASIARTSSQCPMCHKFIAKNRSWVIKLDRPISPRCAQNKFWDGWYSIDTGEPYNFGGARPKPGPRWFVHEYCFNAAQEVLYGE